MIEKIKVEEAVGKPLLHDITAIMDNGFKGVLFKRNQIIRKEDIEKLKDIGKEHIYVGELSKNQVHEEDAIKEIIDNLTDENISISDVSEGKITLRSKSRGIFVINRKLLKDINSIGDYTIATIRSFSKVGSGDKLAGARIIPLWTSRDQVNLASSLIKKDGPLLRVYPYKKLRVGALITGEEIFSGRIKDRFEEVLLKKLQEFDHDYLGAEILPDDPKKIVKTYEKFKNQGADLIVFSGGMSVDPDDITPTSIRNTGAEVISQGIPMQPGNMLMLAKDENTYLVGVPGASIHSEITSFDYILPRIFATIPIKKEDFIDMAEGGLL